MNESIQSGVRLLTLERLSVYSQQATAGYVLRNAEYRSFMDHQNDVLVQSLISHVLGDPLDPSMGTVTFDTWTSWWQHTKSALFPTFSAWLRCPPRQQTVVKEVTADNFATFPECRSDYPADLGRPVRMSMFRQDHS